MPRLKKSLQGSVLVFSLIILTMFLISAIAVVSVSVVEKKSALSTQKSILAFQAADSGAERVIKAIYRNNSPPLTGLGSVALNADMTNTGGRSSTLHDLAAADRLSNVADGEDTPKCDVTNEKIIAQNKTDTFGVNGDPDYTFEVTFYDNSLQKIGCNDMKWRDKVIRIKSEGFYHNSSRVVEIGIRPRV